MTEAGQELSGARRRKRDVTGRCRGREERGEEEPGRTKSVSLMRVRAPFSHCVTGEEDVGEQSHAHVCVHTLS